jgi:pyruvate formate lyase activating enzyme
MMINGKPKVMGRDVTVAEVMETVKRDMPYYSRSDGGLTLSGGESLLQPDFARALMMGARDLGINTAMESMGFARYEVIESILPYLDTYLMDIKHTNPQKHKEFTGQENVLMMENAKKIAASRQTNLIIRVPVIPGFNDTKEELMDIARFADALPGVQEIHLLPYHNFGQGKYEGLGRDYPMGDAKAPTAEKMNEFQQMIMRNTALHCQIGG